MSSEAAEVERAKVGRYQVEMATWETKTRPELLDLKARIDRSIALIRLQLDAAEASTVRYDAWHQSAVRTVSKYRRWSQALQERIGRLGREERAVRAAQSAATFRSVAKELLDPETYARIVAETTRRERAEHDG